MALRGADQFPFMLTSDGSMDSYPENKTSKFQVLLRDPLEIGDEDWEVCLSSINYPYTWTNMGPSAKVSMKYYLSHEDRVQVVDFPNWYCHSMEEVVSFMTKEVASSQSRSGKSMLGFTLDEIGRLIIKSTSDCFDIGFSDNMLKLLGLAGHRYTDRMKMDAFEERQKIREILDMAWNVDAPLPYANVDIRRRVLMCDNVNDFVIIIGKYIDTMGCMVVYHRHPEVSSIDVSDVVSRDNPNDPLNQSIVMTFELKQVMKFVFYNLKNFFSFDAVPNKLNAVMPGRINPIQRMFVYMNIVEPIDLNNKFVRLLKLVNTQGVPYKTTQDDFINPMYLPLQKGKISLIEVLIADETGEPVSFQSGTAVLTLHFRRAAKRRFRML